MAERVNAEFESIFAQLRKILEPHAAQLKVSVDASNHYCLDVPYSAKLKKGYPVAWVKVGKNYVSYHFMPIYMFPKLRDGLSEELRARMQGKSCFNFKAADEAVFEELEQVTAKGFALAKESGFGP